MSTLENLSDFWDLKYGGILNTIMYHLYIYIFFYLSICIIAIFSGETEAYLLGRILHILWYVHVSTFNLVFLKTAFDLASYLPFCLRG